MSTLTIDLITSLDGYGAADGWPGYWGEEGPELLAWVEENLAEDHTIVMGGNTYRTMSRIVAEEEDPSFARMAEIPKIVFSKKLSPPLEWDNTQVLDEEPVAALRRLKAEGTAPIRTLGSISLNKSLLEAGIVDLLQLVIFPVVTGQTGLDHIYADWPDLDLDLVTTRTFDGRTQLVQYVPRLH